MNLGDSVTFTGDTQDFTAKVTSLRKVDWGKPATKLLLHLPAGCAGRTAPELAHQLPLGKRQRHADAANREFPTVSLLDIGAILKQVGQVLEQVEPRAGGDGSAGDRLWCAVAAGAGAGGHASASSGAGGLPHAGEPVNGCRATLWSEFALLGLVAGLVAAIGAETALAVLQRAKSSTPVGARLAAVAPLPVCGAVLLSYFGGGWLGTRLLKGKALFRQFVS